MPPKGSLVTVTATGTAASSISLDGESANSWTGTGGFSGSLVGLAPARGSGQGWGDPTGSASFGTSRWVFTGTIDGLGTGTMTFDRIGFDPARPGSTSSSTARVTSKGSQERDRSPRTGHTPTPSPLR